MPYITLPIEVDADDAAEQMYARMAELVPGWEPSDGNLDVWLLQVVARTYADLAEVATGAADTLFRYVGESMFGLPPKSGTSAVFTTTWTATEAGTFVIPAGTNVGVRAPDGTIHQFATTEEVTVDTGTPATKAGVLVTAVEAGAAASGLPSTTAGNVVLLDPLEWVASVTGDELTYGGTDPESDDEYLNRLRDELTILAPRPITASDFAVMARRVSGVGKSWAVDGYNPGDQTSGNEKMVTVVVAAEDGTAVSQATLDAVKELLEEHREVNFVVHVMNPGFVAVNVEVDVVAYPGWATATVQATVQEAVEGHLNPDVYSDPPPEAGEYAGLATPTHVRFGDVLAAVDNAYGVNYVTAVRLGEDGSPIGASNADLSLTGTAPVKLPTLAALTVNVTEV